MLKKIVVFVGLAALVAACSSEPTLQTGADAEMVGNLAKVDHSRTDLAYLDPEADFGKYTKVMVTPLGLDKVEIIQPSRTSARRTIDDWELTDGDRQALEEAFHEAMVKQLQEKGTFPLVTEPGHEVLQISAAITSIAPTAAKDADMQAGRSYTYTESSGSMSIFVAFADSDNGEVLGIIKDTRTLGGQTWGRNNSVSNMAEVRRAFNSWAAQIQSGLEKLQQGTAE